MNFTNVIQSKTFRGIIYGVLAALVALIVFQAGVFVGYRRATFSYRWGENYHRNFGGPRGGFMMPLRGDDFTNPHGTFGKIIKIDLPTIAVQASDGTEKSIVIDDNTTIRRFQETLTSKDLKVDDPIVVIGEPNDQGQIEAKLIRLMPAASSMMAPQQKQPR